MTTKIKCSFCRGTGKDPFDLLSGLSDCLVCKGTGAVEVQEPMAECLFCAGSGVNPLGARVACIVCGGRGFNHCDTQIKCTQCKGKGKASDGLPCARCGGKGFRGN